MNKGRKTTQEERAEIVAFCIENNKNYTLTVEKYNISYQQIYSCNFSFRHHNLDYAYMAFDIKEDQVPAALDAIRLFKMRGANVTMPCKNEVAKHMDELSPELWSPFTIPEYIF